MPLVSLLKSDLVLALKNRQTEKTELLRCLFSKIKNQEINLKRPLKEEEVVLVIRQELKQRLESQQDANRAGRTDLVKKAEEAAKYLESLLPKMLSEADARREIEAELAKLTEADKQTFGLAMSKIMPKLKGRALGEQAAKIVKEILT